MSAVSRLQKLYKEAKENKWLGYFTVFCRIALAIGFIPSGIVKISGERFTALPGNHPLGHYFDALHLTGYYYTFIGVVQLVTALLLLIPRTALLGALMYFPTILNICILTYATRFEGTRITTLMVLANLYLLCWDLDRLKHILPLKRRDARKALSSKFPFAFFGSVVVIVALVVIINQHIFELRPGNSVPECRSQCITSNNPKACEDFCDCIYKQGKPLDTCLKLYDQAKRKK